MNVSFRELVLRAAPGRVMTPRPASEALVEAAVALVGDRRARVADVGTGSGAIALALAKALPNADVFATDTSPEAVALARENARALGLEHRVTILDGDLLDPVPGELDVVVANLPYLPLAEAALHDDVAAEPRDAVFAPGDGLDPYRRLVEASRERLDESGSLVIQLRRRVFVASYDRLDMLAALLDGGRKPHAPLATAFAANAIAATG